MQITRCCEAHIPLLFEHFKAIYPLNPRLRERDYFDWQFKDSPMNETDEYTFWLCIDSDSIQGFIGYVPLQVRYGMKVHPCCYLQNWWSVRRDGIGMNLLWKAVADYDYRFMLGTTRVAEQIYERLRIPLLSVLPRWIGIIDPDKVINIFKIRNPLDEAKLYDSGLRLTQNLSAAPVEHIQRFDDNKDFTLNHMDTIKGYVQRTGKYLNWRYFDIPCHNYQAICGENKQYVVYRIEKIKGFEESTIRILEWNAWGEWEKRALSSILQAGINHNAILVDFFCTAQEIGARLMKLGFIPATAFHQPIPYLFRPICHGKEIALGIDIPPHYRKRILNFSDWYITKGDSDLDRIKL